MRVLSRGSMEKVYASEITTIQLLKAKGVALTNVHPGGREWQQWERGKAQR